jgi:transposase-like protein
MKKTNPFVCPHCNKAFDELPVDDGYSEGNRDFAWFECPNCHKLWLEEIYVFGMVVDVCTIEESEEEK